MTQALNISLVPLEKWTKRTQNACHASIWTTLCTAMVKTCGCLFVLPVRKLVQRLRQRPWPYTANWLIRHQSGLIYRRSPLSLKRRAGPLASLVSVYKSLVIPNSDNTAHQSQLLPNIFSHTPFMAQSFKDKADFHLNHCNEFIMSLLQWATSVVVSFRWMADTFGRSQSMLGGFL